jgi:dolichyl-phosphate beta-glucosyltransferase
MPEISIVIPAYNEGVRLPQTLVSVYQFLLNTYSDFEVIVVNDGSTDDTVDVVEDFARHHDSVRLISYSQNQGKGFAVRAGMLAAHGDYVLMNDADGSSPIGEVVRLQDALQRGADIAIGSRNKPDADKKVETLAYRKYLGNIFNLIVQTMLLRGINDTQCGFKLFKRSVAQNIFEVAQLNGFAFDVEILYIARIMGYKIEELAINWTNVPGSKVNLILDSAKMFVEILGIKIRSWFGAYQRERAKSE